MFPKVFLKLAQKVLNQVIENTMKFMFLVNIHCKTKESMKVVTIVKKSFFIIENTMNQWNVKGEGVYKIPKSAF